MIMHNQIINFLKQFQQPREEITGVELVNLQASAYILWKELTKETLEADLSSISIKFATDKEYNIMWETTVLLLVRDMLILNIHPSISTTVPKQELQEVLDKLKEWTNKLSKRIEVINP